MGQFQKIIFALALFVAAIQADHDVHLHSATSSNSDGSASAHTISSGDAAGGNPSSLPDLLRQFNIKIPPNDKISSASASAISDGRVEIPSTSYGVPVETLPPSIPPIPIGGGFPGGYPYFPFGGFGKSGHFSLQADGGIFGGLAPYFPIIEKIILAIGGGILLLVILAILKASLAKGGFLHILGSSFADAFAGSGAVNLGPLQASGTTSGAVAFNRNNPQDTHRIIQATERRF